MKDIEFAFGSFTMQLCVSLKGADRIWEDAHDGYLIKNPFFAFGMRFDGFKQKPLFRIVLPDCLPLYGYHPYR